MKNFRVGFHFDRRKYRIKKSRSTNLFLKALIIRLSKFDETLN